MATLAANPSTAILSTAWMPLDGLIQEWGAFGAEQTISAPALHAVGMAFCALARETTARTYYTVAWPATSKVGGQQARNQKRADEFVGFSPVMLQVRTLLSRKEAHMPTLWGDEVPQPTPTTKHTVVHTAPTPVLHTAAACATYGRDWMTTGMSGEKTCRACGTKGYCPICTPNPPQDAHPFYCSRHTPLTESTVHP